jgi:large subunit ribosomal protein L15
MRYHELKTNKVKSRKRVGRGIAAGQGKTAGRGTKGQGARTGSSKRPGFEGGQNPLMQRMPKLPGFRSRKPAAELVYTRQLDRFANKTVDAAALAEAGIITSAHSFVKLITKGDVTKKVDVRLPAASASAIEAVQKAGGSFQKVTRLARDAAPKDDKQPAVKS